MARNKIPDELLTEEQKIRRQYNERHRRKSKPVKQTKSKPKPVQKQILMNGTDGKLYNQEVFAEQKSSQIVQDLNSYRFEKFEKISQINERKKSQITEISLLEFNSIINKLSELNEKISQIESLKFSQMNERISQIENNQISQISQILEPKTERENWKNFLQPMVGPSFVSNLVKKGVSLFVILLSLIALVAFSVSLSAPFFGQGKEGSLSIMVIEGVSCLFMLIASRFDHWSKKLIARVCAFSLMGVSLLFCFDSIKQNNLKSHAGYQEIETQISLSDEKISRLSLQVSALPIDWVSKRATLEQEISKERVIKEELSNKLKDSSIIQVNTIQNLAPLFVRIALCLGILVLFELMSGLLFSNKIQKKQICLLNF